MTLKQRRTPLDKFLLHVVFPTICNSPLKPLLGCARWWHTAMRPAPASLGESAAEAATNQPVMAPLSAKAA